MWSRNGRLLDRQTHSNEARTVDGIRRLDTTGIGEWLVEAIARYRGHPVDTLIPTGHGAGVAAIVDGALAFAPLDYEQTIPADIMTAYRAERDPFAITGSPALPDGLNMGSQLFWLDRLYPEAMASATLVPWAQYWAWFLTGIAKSEMTSLACHTDLWFPGENRFSPMAKRLGWAERFAPLAHAADPIGRVKPDIAAVAGLPAAAKVLAGIHDSNAALLSASASKEIARREATILSTGTWFIAMRLAEDGSSTGALSEHRDGLINVDANGRCIPSARFMGGREIEVALGSDADRIDIADDQAALISAAAGVVAEGAMLLPTFANGCGPFPDGQSRWIEQPADRQARRAAVALYAALVTDASLDLVGTSERLVIEGRFANCDLFVRALASLRPGTDVFAAGEENDVSFGALRLINPHLTPAGQLKAVEPLGFDLTFYRAIWRVEAERDLRSE